MKLLRFGKAGQEKPGCLDQQGNIRDLSAVITDVNCDTIDDAVIRKLQKLDLATLPLVDQPQRFGSPIANPRNLIGIGLNYKDHGPAAKNQTDNPDPAVFFMHTSSLCGANDPIWRPLGATALDFEAEVALVVGKPTYRVSRQQALNHIAAYATCNDISERDYQNNRGGGLCKGKSSPGFTALGPYLVTPDEIADPFDMKINCKVNGITMQESSTKEMLCPLDELVAYLSYFMQLLPGDVISTGTPARTMNPTPKLVPGDVLEMRISGLGERKQIVMESPWGIA